CELGDHAAFAETLFDDERLIVAKLSDDLHAAVLGRLPIFLKGIVIVHHQHGQKTVSPTAEDLEQRVLSDLNVGRVTPIHELGRPKQWRRKQAFLVMEKTIVVERAVGVRASEKRNAAAVADVVFQRYELIV